MKELAESLPDAEISCRAADVTRPEDMEGLAKLALDRYGRIAAIFNTAGVMPTAMTHIAIQEALDGGVVDWMEHVSDEQYRG